MHEQLRMLLLELARPAGEDVELAREEAIVVQFVGGGEVRHQAHRLDSARVARQCEHARSQPAVACAQAAHPRVELDVHPPAARLGDGAHVALAPHDHVDIGRQRVGDVLQRERSHHEDRHFADACLAQLTGLLRAGHGEPACSPGERGACAGRRAVAVAVGLDDRAQLGARAQLRAQPRAVALDRREVHARLRARRVHGPSSSRAAGSASITSVAITPSTAPWRRAASRPADACSQHARRRRLEGVQALREQRCEDAREHVAGAGRGERRAPAAADCDAPVRMRDQRVVALEHDDRLALLGRRARVSQPLALDVLAVEPQQARELAGVRREDRRVSAAGQRAQAPGVCVQTVGVEHHRRLHRGGELAREGDTALAAPQSRAERERPAAGECSRARRPRRREQDRRPARPARGSSAQAFPRRRPCPAATAACRQSRSPPRRAWRRVRPSAERLSARASRRQRRLDPRRTW